MTFSYDGTNYQGLQLQPDFDTVQAQIEKALLHITRQEVRIHCCGRTDAGVHAMGMTAHFDLPDDRDPLRLRIGMNAVMPHDIRVIDVQAVDDEFHARFDATHKEYRYFIWLADVLPPFKRFYYLHDRRKLDIEAMRKAAEYLVGEHDFKAFCATAPGQGGRLGTIRTVYKIDITQNNEELVVAVDGSGFLYKMVRTIVGFLLRVGRGELMPEDALYYLESKTRTAAIPSAPARGLHMWQIWY